MDNPQRDDRVNDAGPVEDDQLPPRAWLFRNGIYLLLFAGLAVFLYRSFGLDGMWNIAKAGLGLGFVIFIHELGHFAVAKWCDVHVQTFSIGFGPALPGCSFKYGETSYKLALFPLGGYVKMVGEGDSDPESENDPRSFKNKSVGQRMAIISAGVTMNVILAFVCFIVVFTHGKERIPAVASLIDAGGPAWEAGVPTGAEFLQIGSLKARDDRPLYFEFLRSKVALSSGGGMPFEWRVPFSAKVVTAEIEPRRGDNDDRPMIGLSYPPSLQMATAEMAPKDMPYPVSHGSPAAAARPASAFKPGDTIVAMTDPDEPANVTALPEVRVGGTSGREGLFELSRRWHRLAGQEFTVRLRRPGSDPQAAPEEIQVPPAHFAFGDTIIGTTDPEDPAKVTAFREDPRYPGGGKGKVFDYLQRLDLLAGQLMTFRVRRLSGEEEELLLPPAYHYTLGVRMQMGPVKSLRQDSPAIRAGVQPGDILIKVTLQAVSGGASQDFYLSPPRKNAAKPEDRPADGHQLIDPVRLPHELRQWAEAHKKEGVRVRLTVLRSTRDDPQVHEAQQQKELPGEGWAEWDFGRRFDREVPLNRSSPLPVPELGLAYHVETFVEEVLGPPASAADGLQKNDVITEVRFREPGKKWGESKEGDWWKLEPENKPDQWAHVFYFLQAWDYKEVGLKVRRNGAVKTIELTARPDATWPSADRGVLLKTEKVIQKADGIVQAVDMGLEDTWRGLTEVYLFLRGIILRRLSPKNLGGPITIAHAAYRFAQMDFYEFLFFLGMISINLAAFNFLPIPVLDGGHMVFLVYEKLRGKPASEQVQWSATLVGLMLLGGLMITVIILDILKLVA